MKRFTLTVAMLALGAIVCSPKVNAASLVNEIPVKAEYTSQLAKINTNNTVLATSQWKQFSSDEGKFSVLMPDIKIRRHLNLSLTHLFVGWVERSVTQHIERIGLRRKLHPTYDFLSNNISL